MNKWECTYPNCDKIALGVGGAIGLRAIGWYWEHGHGGNVDSILRCPSHWPERMQQIRRTECLFADVGWCNTKQDEKCSICTAEQKADKIQEIL